MNLKQYRQKKIKIKNKIKTPQLNKYNFFLQK